MSESGPGKQDVFNLHSAPALPKGKACVTCRLRKIRCDGARPVCSQCREAQRSEDCEYVAVRAPSSTHALEKRVAALRARVKELQAQHASGATSLLKGDPGTTSPRDPHTALSDSGSGPSLPSVSVPTRVGAIELTRENAELFVGLFFSQNQPLWFLDIGDFRASLGSQTPEGGGVLPGLIVVMGAVTAAQRQTSSLNETALVDSALSRINSAFGESTRAMQAVQAHVLLGTHLLCSGRFTQGLSLLTGGLAFALALGIHRPQQHETLATTFKPPRPILLTPSPASAAEYVRGFWTVFVLERIWAMALGTPTRVWLTSDGQDGGVRVRTPWPEQLDRQYSNTQDALSCLREAGPIVAEGDSPLTLSVKAALLLEQATHVASLMAEDGPEAQALDERVNCFAIALGPPVFASRSTLVAHILLRGATLQLHSRIPGDLRAMNAARALAAVAPVLQPIQHEPRGLLEPAIGIVIPAACRVLITAMLSDTAGIASVQALTGALEAMQGVLKAWETHSAYIGLQLNRVVQERSTVGE